MDLLKTIDSSPYQKVMKLNFASTLMVSAQNTASAVRFVLPAGVHAILIQ
jgi:hypothetical protein